MNEKQNQFTAIDGETLMDMRFPPANYCVKSLMPQGLGILAGAPKIGKSWLALDLCVRVAKGEPLWGMPTSQGSVLYLCLEDTYRRVQERLNRLTDEVPDNIFFAVQAGTLGDGLEEQLIRFVTEHPDTQLIVIDTFQLIRGQDADSSYAKDYAEVRQLRQLADGLGLSILLIHHLRKQGDSDPLNKISGSTGISGAVDAVYVLDRSKRNEQGAVLFCTGRDIESRELELKMNRETCTWELVADSLGQPELLLPEQMQKLVDFMRAQKKFYGSNTEFAEQFALSSGICMLPKALKQMMNRWRYSLEEEFVFFQSSRSNGQRYLEVWLSPPAVPHDSDASAVSDGENTVADSCVPFVTCGTV